jgi:MacB-like periplasmic core domain
MFQDLRYAARSLAASPGLVTVAVLSLGLGIGVNATLFSVFDAVFLRQVSASDPHQVWRIWPGGGNKLSYANYQDLLASKTVPDLAGSYGAELNLRTGDDVEKVSGAPPNRRRQQPSLITTTSCSVVGEVLTANFFPVLGIAASSGRTFWGIYTSSLRAGRSSWAVSPVACAFRPRRPFRR